MLYLQIKERVTLLPGQKITVQDLADVIGEEADKARCVPVDVQTQPGVWKVPTGAVIQALLHLHQPITLLGADEVMLHVEEQKKKGGKIRAAAAFLLLMLGSALAITWFHADVGMQEAQTAFYRLISGKEAGSPWMMTIPYALGVGLGVGMYYSVFSKRKTVSPLDIKLQEYCEKTEKTAGRIP